MSDARTSPRVIRDEDFSRWLISAVGAYTRRALYERFGRRRVDAAIKGHRLVPIAPLLYSSAAHAGALWTRLDAARQWAGPRYAVGGLAALFALGAARRPPTVVTVLVADGRRLRSRPAWADLVRVSELPQTVHVRGLCVVAAPEALCQAWASLPVDSAPAVVIDALASSLVSTDEALAAAGKRTRLPRRRAFERAVADFANGSHSYLEWRATREVFTTDAFPDLLRQHVVSVDRQTFRFDFFDASTLTAIEVDGAAFHDWQSDINRDSALAGIGIHTLRYSYRDVTERPAWCRSTALAALEARRRIRALRS